LKIKLFSTSELQKGEDFPCFTVFINRIVCLKINGQPDIEIPVGERIGYGIYIAVDILHPVIADHIIMGREVQDLGAYP
jgi:hypothetical protein